ncbi:MAG: replicative DNA helicase [Kiritimatiellae bacterium]|nr:replicative DNA helicase [Kiritimatiellia bacterium]
MATTQAAPSFSHPPRSDRLPPYSEEAERGVLGSALLDAERVIDLAVERKTIPESFYIHAHQVLFGTLVNMNHENRPVDLLTVGERLRDLGLIDQVGGEPYLESLVDSTPTAAHAEYYIDLVHQKYLFRTIIQRSMEAIESCYGTDQEAEFLLGKTEQSFFEISDIQHGHIQPWPDLVKETMEDFEAIYQQKKGVTGIPTGYKDLDKKLLGFQPGDMIVLAARPSMGKTSLALNFTEHIALGTHEDRTPRSVALFSLEMSKEQLVRRMICSRAHVSGHQLASGILTTVNHGRLMHAADALMKGKIIIDDTAGLSAFELRSRARRLQRKYDVELIIVDYLQLMHYSHYAQDRQREVAAISGALKAMAKELRVPVLVLSQLSRAPETRDRLAKPKLSDLRDSGAIEQDADVVCLLRRPCKYPDDPDHDDIRLAIVDVAKHRNGPTGEVYLNFEEDFMSFETRAHGVDDSYEFSSNTMEKEL